jgi:hypothetical protein
MPQLSPNDNIFRLVANTLPLYLKEVEDETIRNQKLPALLMKQTKFNQRGRFPEWPVLYNKGNTITRSPGEAVDWQPVDRLKSFSLPWAQYINYDKYTDEEAWRNNGAAAIVKYYDEIPKYIASNLGQDYGINLYNNGNTAGQSNQLYGIETPMGVSGTTAITGTPVMDPAGTYAGFSTALAAYGGTDPSTPWPIAQVPPAYDFNSPLILDATSSLVKTASNYAWSNPTGFEQRNEEIMSFAVTYSRRNVMGKEGMLSLFLFNDQWYHYFKMTNRAKEKIQVMRGEGETLVSMGFTDVMNFDGAEVTSEWSVPANTGYGLNLKQMTMLAERDRLFVANGPEWDPYSKSYLVDSRLMGQLCLRPRHMVKIANYASTGA